MKLSENTLQILKNFATINSQIVFKPGKELSTISAGKTVIGTAKIKEEIPIEFGIYNLSEFISAIDLITDPELDFQDKSVVITGSTGRIAYYYSDTETLNKVKKFNFPSSDVKLDITTATLDLLKKAASTFGHTTIQIEGDGTGKIELKVVDQKNPTAHKYSIVADENNECKREFSAVMVIGNLKMLPGDYEISISEKLISSFKSKTSPVEYFIALETTSKFD